MSAPEPYARLWRALVDAPLHALPERVVYVEAGSGTAAVAKIAGLVAVLEGSATADVQPRIRSLRSGARLLEEGLSVDRAMRLFEVGYDRGQPLYVEQPLFVTSAPGDLCRLWAVCRAARDSGKEVSRAPGI